MNGTDKYTIRIKELEELYKKITENINAVRQLRPILSISKQNNPYNLIPPE
jgi:hypothetical protein